MMIMSMDLAEKTRLQPRQGSLLRPRPIGRDRVVLSRARVCRCCACLGRGTHEFARLWLGRSDERVREICSSGSVMLGCCGNRRLQSANRTVEDFLISASQVRAQGAPTGGRRLDDSDYDARLPGRTYRPHRLRTRCRDRRGSDRGLRAGQGRRPSSAAVDSATARRACSRDRRASPAAVAMLARWTLGSSLSTTDKSSGS
jgi:hypothetical protein